CQRPRSSGLRYCARCLVRSDSAFILPRGCTRSEVRVKMTRMKKAGITSLSFCKLVRTGQMSKSTTATDLGGTSWQLVRFQNGDDETLIPDDKSKYTIV